MVELTIGLTATVGSVWLLVACSSQVQTLTAAPPSLVGTQLDAPVPTALLHLPLTNQSGQRVTLSSFTGKILVLSDMMTLCQESCPIGTASMLQAARAVDAAALTDKIEFLSITIDPGRDDTRHLAAYQRAFGRLPNWELLTGSTADVNELWNKLGIWRRTIPVSRPYPRDWLTGQPLTVDIQHSDDLIFVDAGQRFRFEIDGPGKVPTATAIPRPIFAFMDQQGRQNIQHPSAGSWSTRQVLDVLGWLGADGGAR